MHENPEALFLAELETIERAIRFAAHRGGLRHDEAEDFASYVKLKLIEKDYAIIAKFESRSSFGAYISVVIQRILLDYRNGQWGKWHASAEAKRIGEPAITIEAMLVRDGRTIEEIHPTLVRRWPDLTRERIEEIVRRLPSRIPRAREVDLESAADAIDVLASDEAPHFESDRTNLAQRIADVVRRTMTALEERDRLIFRLHFEGSMKVSDISRMLQMEQKPLYRRLQRVLLLLRKQLECAGVSAEDAEAVLSSRAADLDFGFGGEVLPHDSSPEEDA